MHIARNVISCLILSALMSAVFAHAHWILPAPRTGENNNIGQCGGVVAGRPGDTVFAGDSLLVRWQEYVDHNGYFIVKISNDSDKTFQEVLRVNDTARNGTWTRTIQIPRVSPRRITLQLIQAMVTTTTIYYYSCMDIQVLSKGTGAAQRSIPFSAAPPRTVLHKTFSGRTILCFKEKPVFNGSVQIFSLSGTLLSGIREPMRETAQGNRFILPALRPGGYLIRISQGNATEFLRWAVY